MIYTAKDSTRIFFDDYELDDDINGDLIAWAEMCPDCRKKLSAKLGDRFDIGCACGTCGVKGCQNEADCYADFKIGEVSFLW